MRTASDILQREFSTFGGGRLDSALHITQNSRVDPSIRGRVTRNTLTPTSLEILSAQHGIPVHLHTDPSDGGGGESTIDHGDGGERGVTRLPPSISFLNFQGLDDDGSMATHGAISPDFISGRQGFQLVNDILRSFHENGAGFGLSSRSGEGVGTPTEDDCIDRSTGVWRPSSDDVRVTPSMCCPITTEVFCDPVVASDGKTYERAAITKWFVAYGNSSSPCTGQPMSSKDLLPNHTMRAVLDEICSSHPSSPSPSKKNATSPKSVGSSKRQRV
jgi:hypothetical protein